MIVSYCLTNGNFKKAFKINLHSHNINHAKCILTFILVYTDLGIDIRYIIKILKEMATI